MDKTFSFSGIIESFISFFNFDITESILYVYVFVSKLHFRLNEVNLSFGFISHSISVFMFVNLKILSIFKILKVTLFALFSIFIFSVNDSIAFFLSFSFSIFIEFSLSVSDTICV
jgi:hypothetical protein